MAPGPAIPTVWLLIPAAVALVAAAVLVRRGIRGTRRGSAPHCRGCDYPLVGIDSQRCPECGADLQAPGAVARGERVRRRSLAGLGIAMALAGLLLALYAASPAVRSFDSYTVMPAGWLIDRLSDPSKSASDHAWSVLKRRMQSRELSPKHRERLAELALRNQAAGSGGELLDWLGDAVLHGKISDAQKDRFFQQAVKLDLRVRPKVVLGDPIPYELREQCRGPGANQSWEYEIEYGDMSLDGTVVIRGGASGGRGGLVGLSTSRAWIPCDRTGRHTVATSARVRIFHGNGNANAGANDGDAKLMHERTVTLSADTEVLSAAPADYVTLTDDPSLVPILQASLRASNIQWDPETQTLSGKIEIKSAAPGGLAFEVIGRAGGKEQKIRNFDHSSPGNVGAFFEAPGVDPAIGGAGRIDVVFRSSEAVARRTVDLVKIWKGEVVARDVPVKLKPPSPKQ